MEFVNRYKVVGYTKDSIKVFISIMDKEPTIETLKSFAENYTLKIAYFEITQIMQVVENEIEKHDFTDDELSILRNIDKKWNYIARDKDNNALFLYDYKPHKQDDCWGVETFKGECFEISAINVFKNIKWTDKEPVKIDDYVDRS